ncbi:MAG: HNH endonuclease [Caldilinea sp. CFX5]|nr:HNH endonuclease [Caldilinea sp. CFX5]
MSYISPTLRQAVAERARHRCEYCLYPRMAAFLTFEIEHIIAEKHSGQTNSENLALSCPHCNRAKGTDLGSLEPITKLLTPFYNPRTQEWRNHFALRGAEIIPLRPEGRVTVNILQFNEPDRVAEWRRLLSAGLFMLP